LLAATGVTDAAFLVIVRLAVFYVMA